MPQPLRQGPEFRRKAGRHSGPPDQVPSLPGQLVDSSGPQEWARLHETTGQRGAHSDLCMSRPGQLVDHAGHRARARVAQTTGRPHGPLDTRQSSPGMLVHHSGPRAQARVTQDAWPKPRYVRPGPESPGTAGRPRALVPRPESPGTAGRPQGPSDPSTNTWDSFMKPGPLGMVSSHLGELVDATGPRARS